MPTANLPQSVQALLNTYGIGTGSGRNNLGKFQLAQLGQQFGSRDELLSTLANYGQGQQDQINETFTNQGNEALARNAGLGLDLTSKQDSESLGVARAKQSAVGTLNDQLDTKKLGILDTNNQNILGILSGAAQANYQQDALHTQTKLAQQQMGNQMAQWAMNPQLQTLLAAISGAQGSGVPTAGGGAQSPTGGVIGNLKYLGV